MFAAPSCLVVFDVDGTLIDSPRVDDACFVQALDAALGIRDIDTDWSAYTDCTDVGIVSDLFTSIHGRAPDDAAMARFIDAFAGELEAAHTRDPMQFAPIAGAGPLLSHLLGSAAWTVAIATGGMRRTAHLKLGCAGLDVDGIPFASSDDCRTREGIVRTAIHRAGADVGRSAFERIVLVGDAVWDLRTARNLGHPFVGVATDTGARRLQEEGAGTVVADFSSLPLTVDLLRSAPVPAKTLKR